MVNPSRTLLVHFILIVMFAMHGTGCATTTAPTTKLDGPTWRLSAWSVSSQRASDFAITARFADGRVSGRSAVNSYGGAAVAGPDQSLALRPLASTKMAGPEPAMQAESAYFTLLEGVRSYRIEGAQLTLRDANGNEALVFDAGGE